MCFAEEAIMNGLGQRLLADLGCLCHGQEVLVIGISEAVVPGCFF